MGEKSIKGKVAIVTGAGQGIGRAIALRLASEGAHVVVNDIDEKKAAAVSEEIFKLGARAIPIIADVSQKPDVEEMVKKVKDGFQQVHILVNNAGVECAAQFGKISVELWHQVLGVNLIGPFLCCQLVLPLMIEQKWGRIINISSMAYKGQGWRTIVYDASKGGLNAMTKSLSIDVARYNITVNAVCPSWIDTAMTQSQDLLEIKEKITKLIPMRRLGWPEEIAAVACFLATEDASYITGQNIDVNGGWLR